MMAKAVNIAAARAVLTVWKKELVDHLRAALSELVEQFGESLITRQRRGRWNRGHSHSFVRS